MNYENVGLRPGDLRVWDGDKSFRAVSADIWRHSVIYTHGLSLGLLIERMSYQTTRQVLTFATGTEWKMLTCHGIVYCDEIFLKTISKSA